MSKADSVNATPGLRRVQRIYSASQAATDSPVTLDERVEALEKRLERAEHLLHMAEDMNKLHQELDEIRNNEVSRKLEEMDARLRKMETAHADVIYECENRIKQTMTSLERGLLLTLEAREEDVKELRARLEEVTLPGKEVQTRLLALESETSEKFSAVLSTLEDLAKVTKKNEYQLSESRETLKQVESEQVHLLLLARESRQSRLALEASRSEEPDEVELFLSNI